MRADKRPQKNKSEQLFRQSQCDITIYADKGSLALRFPKRHNPLWEQLDGKSLNGKPKCLGIGKYGFKDDADGWKRANQIAVQIEADLDHPEWHKLFDVTLAKYGIGSAKYAKMADVLQMPGVKQPKPETTVGELWEDYLLWKETQVEPTTFHDTYQTAFTNIIKGLKWNNKTKSFMIRVWDLGFNPKRTKCRNSSASTIC
ncbi:MAG: hypothetical protein HC894_19185 [Microcoleus sp. SM1_3_4]|nr:hypothetical protein [Microcoleus sp. SM1_3_4]